MKTYKTINKQVQDQVFCDVCGKSCTYDNLGSDYATLEAMWGYGSKYDGTVFDIQLCEKCFEHTIDWMKAKRYSYLNADNTFPSSPDYPFDGKPYNIGG